LVNGIESFDQKMMRFLIDLKREISQIRDTLERLFESLNITFLQNSCRVFALKLMQ